VYTCKSCKKKKEIHSGPFVKHDLHITFETVDGTRFVAEAYTDILPIVFEIKYADDVRLEQLDETE
jgi:hypothetical protein